MAPLDRRIGRVKLYQGSKSRLQRIRLRHNWSAAARLTLSLLLGMIVFLVAWALTRDVERFGLPSAERRFARPVR